LRQRGHAFLLHVPDEAALDAHTRAVLQLVRLPHPGREPKLEFLRAALAIYSQARLDSGLEPGQAAYLSANTPNWGLETLLRRSHFSAQPVRPADLIARRAEDVAAVSEGMLTPMEEQAPELYGLTVNHAWGLLERVSQGLRQGDPRTPHNILLAGAPGTGKTELARRVAVEAGVNCYRISSPKAGIVGETERRADLLFRILNEWAPNVAFADEVTEILTTDRPEHDLDAGASRAVIGALLSYLGDERRRGRTVFLGASNCPWRMSDALRGRFVVVPVLMPLEEDYPGIVGSLVRRVAGVEIAPATHQLREAAAIFYAKGASPRHIATALTNTCLLHGNLDAAATLEAAQDFCGDTGRASAEYADLWAIKLTTNKSFFPWCGRRDYKLPAYLEGIVDGSSGEVDREALERRIRELQSTARV
ncbi:MAG: AAA family ATPase, partial [Bryobacteraceae bacterium]